MMNFFYIDLLEAAKRIIENPDHEGKLYDSFEGKLYDSLSKLALFDINLH